MLQVQVKTLHEYEKNIPPRRILQSADSRCDWDWLLKSPFKEEGSTRELDVRIRCVL